MKNDQQDSQDVLVKSAAKVTTLSAQEVAARDAAAEQAGKAGRGARSIALAGIMIASLFAVGLALFFVQGSDGQGQPQANIVQEPDAEASGGEVVEEVLTAVDVEAKLRIGEVVWGDAVDAVIAMYDDSNENVRYQFEDDTLTLSGNGLPNHETGTFPNPGNPNSISEQSINLTIPRSLVYQGSPTSVRTFGYTLGGIKIEPGTAERDPATNAPIEAFNPSGVFNAGTDDQNAHVQPDGTYHYHGLPGALVTTGEGHSNLIGFAVDGFPIYADHGYRDPFDAASPVDHMTSSWKLKTGERPAGEPEGVYSGDYTSDFEYESGRGDLDECNGRFTLTPEFPQGVYAYFITESFPFFGRCVMGEVVIDIPAGAPLRR